MKSRLLATLAVASTLLLTACDIGSTPPTPTMVPGASPSVGGSASNGGELSPVTVETTDATRIGNLATERTINLPPGFGMKVFAAGLTHVRKLALSPDGVLYATVRAEGRVVRLPDADNDGVADEVQTVADNLQGVHGIAFKDGVLYVATEVEVLRLEDTDGDHVADNRVPIIGDMPTGGTGRAGANHSTRTIEFSPDGKLYVAMGSSCNACLEQDPRRAAISRYTVDGKLEKVFAKGIRNAVGIKFHPITGELWAVNNGRDGLGDELPPEAVYKVREDGNYGWPYCYGDRVPDTTLDFPTPQDYCASVDVPTFTLPPHSAPLGLAFYYGDQFPADYKGDMFIGIHGSWDRTSPRGYKIVRAHFKDSQPDTGAPTLIEDFATGWLLDDLTHWGRPVDLLVAPDGSLFVTDDAGMAIYKIYYKDPSSMAAPGR
jgi:glucose/arabinose dehydrogenase